MTNNVNMVDGALPVMTDDRNQFSKPIVDTSSQLKIIRRRFLESVSAVLLILSIIGVPLSSLRIYHTGLNLNHISHFGIGILTLVVFFFRKRLNDRWLASVLLLIFISLSLAAFLQYGIVSAGFYFAAACIFICGMIFGLQGGIICSVFYFAVVSTIAYLWISGYLTFSGDVREYITLPTVWGLLSISFLITTAVFFVSANGFFASLKELVETINSQKQEIEQQTTELIKTNLELETALNKVKTLSGLLPMCSHCKKIRDDKGYWNQIEAYIQDHTEAEVSHGICKECAEKYYPDYDIYEK